MAVAMTRMNICRTITGMILAVAGCVVASTDSHAQNLPSEDEVNGIMKLCAVGRIQRYEGEVRGKIEFWKKGAAATGSASVEDLGALLSAIKPDPNSVKIYQIYVSCIKDNLAAYLSRVTLFPRNSNQANVDDDGFQLTRDDRRICKTETEFTPNTSSFGDDSKTEYFKVCLMANGAWVRPPGSGSFTTMGRSGGAVHLGD